MIGRRKFLALLGMAPAVAPAVLQEVQKVRRPTWPGNRILSAGYDELLRRSQGQEATIGYSVTDAKAGDPLVVRMKATKEVWARYDDVLQELHDEGMKRINVSIEDAYRRVEQSFIPERIRRGIEGA